MCYLQPLPQIGEETPTNRRTNRRIDFSAKQAPSALDLSPRPLTHLPYGCSIVAFMWKRKISLNFFENFFRHSVSIWSLSTDIAVHSGGPVVSASSHTFADVGSIPTVYGAEFFCIFFHLSSCENWFSMHKQSLPEEEEFTQASHLHLPVC